VAHLTGGDAPSGTITWNVYASTDTSCSSPLNSSPIAVSVIGDGDYTSPSFSPSAAGTYQWVATYTGDANNVPVSTKCNDPSEQSSETTSPTPAISLTKLESFSSASGFVPGGVGQTVYYQMDVINTGNTPLALAFTDNQCDSGTLAGPTVISGSYDAGTKTLSARGEIQYTCSHVLAAGDEPYTNTASVIGTPPPGGGPPVGAQASVQAFADTPGMSVVKLERDGTSGSFTSGPVTGSVGDTIYYEIQVTNTGNMPLALSLNDPHCDAGTIQGPTSLSGMLTGNVLSPGGVAQFTCSHVLAAGDAPSFTNVGTGTGQPPSGPPLTGTGIVTVNVTTASIQVVKLQSLSAAGPFTTNIITAQVGQRIYYEIRVTNTGGESLNLSVSDPVCDPGTRCRGRSR
jgi:uncharacterized repeat protein (TIGR01451 family)